MLLAFGTPPGPGMAGVVMNRLRQQAMDGADRVNYMEWSAESGADLDDPHTWLSANPAMYIRLAEDIARTERASMDDDSFRRERLGMFSVENSAAVIPSEAWNACADPDSKVVGDIVIAVDTSPSRMTSIAFAGLREDQMYHVEVVESGLGTGWVVDRVIALAEKSGARTVIIDSKSQAASLADEFKTRTKKVRVKLTNTQEIGVATAIFYESVLAGSLRHLDDPTTNNAALTASKRSIGVGGLWTWNRQNSTHDLTALMAVTLAVWGVQNPDIRKRSGIHAAEQAAKKRRVILM